MRVAFVSFDFPDYCIQLATALAAQAEVFLLLSQRNRSLPNLTKLHGSIDGQVLDKPKYREPVRQLRLIFQLVQRIRSFDPDVVHLQQGHLWFNFALPLLRRYPLVLTIHDPRHHIGDRESRKVPQKVMDFGFRRANQVIVHGQQLKRMVVEECGVPSQIVHVIPHILIGDDPPRSPVQENDKLVLFFGRIWEYKGLEYLIRAEPLITAQVPGAKIIIAGQGEDLGRYRQWMVHPERFIIHNRYIPDEQRAQLFRQASVIVLPYVDASQSGVIPLAYSAAKPVVATAVGSLPEMVEHGRTGYLIPPRDEKALADAVVRLLKEKRLRRRLGANAKRKLYAECSPAVVARHTLAVYRAALNSALERRASIADAALDR